MKKTLISLATLVAVAASFASVAEAKSKIHVDLGLNLGDGIYIGAHSGKYYEPEVVAYLGDEEPECHWVKKKTKFKIAGRGTVTQIEKKWICD